MNNPPSRDAVGWAYAIANQLIRNFPYFNYETRLAHLRLVVTQWTWIASVAIVVLLDWPHAKSPSEFTGNPLIILLDELFDFWNGRAFLIVGALALYTVLMSGIEFFRELYDIKEFKPAALHLMTLIFSLGYLPGCMAAIRSLLVGTVFTHFVASLAGFRGYDYLVVSQGRIKKEDGEEPVIKAGGPAFVIIYSDTAVLLERDGTFTRVNGPGFVFLEPFETIREAVDLRSQVRTMDDVQALTKDGIPISFRVEVEFMIQPSPENGRRDSQSTPYPFRTEAVRHAVYNKSVTHKGEDEDVYLWKDLIMHRARFELRRLLNTYILDRLIEPEESDPYGALDFNETPRRKIQRELRSRLNTRLVTNPPRDDEDVYLNAEDLGVVVLRVTLGHLRIDSEFKEAKEKITGFRIESWKSEWLRRSTVTQARGDAEDIRLKETSRAEAQEQILRAIAHGLETTNATDPANISHVLALRTIEALEQMTLDPRAQIFVPAQTLETLQKLRALYLR